MTESVTLWRIAAETRQWRADDLSGRGAAKYPGRWNAVGEHVVYAAQTLSLAVLETVAHLDDTGLPLNRFAVQLTVPIRIWNRRRKLELSDVDAAWCAIPAGKASVEIGCGWYRSGSSALLLVPSVVVEEECAVLINAKHPDVREVRAKTIRLFEFNTLFRA